MDVPPCHADLGCNDDCSAQDVPPLRADHHHDEDEYTRGSNIGVAHSAPADHPGDETSVPPLPNSQVHNEDKQTHIYRSHVICGNNNSVTICGKLNWGNTELCSFDVINEPMSYNDDRNIHGANISGASSISPHTNSPIQDADKQTHNTPSHIICGNNNYVTFVGNLNLGNEEVTTTHDMNDMKKIKIPFASAKTHKQQKINKEAVYGKKEMEEGTSYMKKIKIPLVSAKTRQRESDDGQPKQQKKEGSRENKRRKDVDIN
jgi:hypothetical protein